MSWLRAVLIRLGWRGGLDRLKREIDDELDFHIEMKVASNVRAGMSEEEALADAKRRLGDVGDLNHQGARILAGAPASPKTVSVFFATYQDSQDSLERLQQVGKGTLIMS